MITFDPVTPAPLATRIARVVLPLLTCFGYLAFRAYPAAAGRIPLGEAVVMGLVIMGLAMVACIALGDLIYPLTSRARQRPGSEELEITAVHARIADADTVIARSCAEEIARLDALCAPRDGWQYVGLTEGGVTATLAETSRRWVQLHDWTKDAGIIRGTLPPDVRRRALSEDTQPYDLFTHEFQPQHHTPPSGFTAPFVVPDSTPRVTGGTIHWPGGDEMLNAAQAQQLLATGRHHRDED